MAVAQPETSEQAEVQAQPDTAEVRAPVGTEVGGEVSGVWKRGTYIVTETVTIPPNDTLIIEAGSTIYFRAPKEQTKFLINSLGQLEIAGTDTVPVVFSSIVPPGEPGRIWGGILYVGNFAGGKVEHAILQQAEIGVQVRRGIIAEQPAGADTASRIPEYILRRATGPVEIRHCTIDSASFNGIVLVGVDSTVVVEDNLIQHCSSGISCEDDATPIIRNNRVFNNSSTGIICSANSNPTITGCTIIGSTTAGIICANNSSPVIDRCVIAKCGIGVSATKSSPQISRCTIATNDFSGIIAYEGAAPSVVSSSIRGNGLASIDNRSTGNIAADRCWWGFIITEKRPAPVLDGAVRREKGEPAGPEQTGRVTVTDPLTSPSKDAPGTPSQADELLLARDQAMSQLLTGDATVSNGDTVWIQMRARDEDPYLEDEATIVISTTTGNPEGTQRVLTELGAATGIYQGYVIASLLAGDPNIVVQVQNGDLIKVETGTVPPLKRQVMFVSEPPAIQTLRINNQRRGVRLIDPRPVFSWRYWDNENDPQAGTEIEIGTDPTWQSPAIWSHQEAGQRLSYAYDGPPLARGQTYFLRVRANDGYNWGRWTESSFHMNTAPPTPQPAFPEDGAIVGDRNQKPRVAVKNVRDPDGDLVSYLFEAYYGEDFSVAKMRVGGSITYPPVLEDTTSEVTVWENIPALIENTRVWWRAKATDGLEESDWSRPWSFTLNTVDDQPQPFNMLEPQRDSTAATIQPRFEWDYSYDPDPGQSVSFLLMYSLDPSLEGATVRKVEPINQRIQYYRVPPSDTLRDNSSYYWTVLLEQNGKPMMRANSQAPDTTSVWHFFVDTGNDPPRIDEIPAVTMTEDTPASVELARYIHDPDNPLVDLRVSARSTPHINAVVSRGLALTLTPERDWFGGPETIRLTVSDPLQSVGIGEVVVTITPVNDPPVASPIPDQTVAEDTDLRLDLNPYVSDVDNRGEDITWSASTDERKLTLNIARGIATIRGTQDWFGGPVPIRFTATDPGGLSASTTANVTVTPVNDPPAVIAIPLTRFKEDESATVDLDNYVSDPDNAKGELTWEAAPDEPLIARIDPATRRATVSAPPNWSGAQRRVVFTVRDPAGLSNQLVAQFLVEGVNDPPVIAAIPDQQFLEDDTLALELDPFVSDPDNAAREMTWTAVSGEHVRARIDNARRRVLFSAPRNWYGGPERIRLTATDPGRLSASQSVNVTIISVPERPVFARISPITIDEDGQYVLALDEYLSDPDHTNDQLTLTVTQPQNVRAELDSRSRRVTISAPPNWNGGPETVGLEAVDPDNERASATVNVTVRPVNDPPVLSTIPPMTFKEDESTTLRLTDYVSDPDNTPQEMRWRFTGNTHVKVQVAQGTATFSADKDWNGAETLTLTASDPGNLSAQASVRVEVTPVDDPPVLRTPPAVAFDEDGSTTLALNDYVADVDNSLNDLTWTIAGNVHVKVQVARGIATFTADPNWHGAESLTVTVADPDGLNASSALAVTVRSVNDPPVISRIEPITFNEDESTAIDLAPYGSDVDGDPITWAAASADPDLKAAISGSRLALSANPNWNGGPVSVTITASDPNGGRAQVSVLVTVTPVNDPPVLRTVPPVAFDEDGSTTLALTDFVSDPDNTPQEMQWAFTGQQRVRAQIARGAATFTAEPNWNGAETLTLTASDPGGLSAQTTIRVTVRSVNDPPVISRIEPITFNEDESTAIDLAPYGSDVDGDPITWAAASADPNLKAALAGNRLTLSANPNWNGGPVSVTITASDPNGGRAQVSVPVTVTPVNDPPVLRTIPPVTFAEDGSTALALNEYVTDVDNSPNDLTWTIAGNVHVKVQVARGTATLTADRDWNGTETLTVTVADPGGLSAQTTVTVTVTPVNDPPVLRTVPPVAFDEDGSTTLALTDFVSDPDNTPQQMRWTFTGQQHVRVQVAEGVATFAAEKDWNGTETLSLAASDPDGLSAQAQVRVTVAPVNDPPVLQALQPLTIREDETGTLDLKPLTSDVDNTLVQLTWTITGGMQIQAQVSNGVATFRPAANWHGEETLTVAVRDRDGASAQQSLRIVVAPVNDPPVISRIPAIRFNEDESTTIDLAPYGSDVDGDPITWAATSADLNVKASVTGSRLALLAAPNWNGGPVNVTITASDPNGGQAQAMVAVTVAPVNDPPVLAAIPPVTFDEDGSAQVTLTEYVSDPDNTPQEMRWEVSGGEHVKVRILRGVATLTADKDWNGTETLTVAVSDRGGLSASGTVQVRVNPVNDPPTLRAIPPVAFDEDGSAQVTLTEYVSDPDNAPQEMRWAFTGATNVKVEVAQGTATFTAEPNWNGTETLTLTVSDPGGLSAQTTVRVRVNPVNDPPTLRAVPPVAFDEDGSTTVQVSDYVTDIDNTPEQMRWSVSGNARVSVRFSGGTATFSAERNWNGEETLTLTVRDPDGATASQQVRVMVRPTNDPPEARDVPDISLESGGRTEIDLSPYATDPDGDALRWEVSGQTGSLTVTISGARLQVTAPAGSSGTSIITLTVTDPAGAQATARVRVNVRVPETGSQ